MDEALASLVYTVTSTSGTASGTLNITILDDAPSVEVGDVDLSDVTLETQDSDTLDGTSVATGSVAAAFSAAVDAQYGADSAGSTVIDGYALTLGEVEHGLTSGGEPIVFTLVDGVVIGSADGTEVLHIELDADTGALTVTQSGPVDHAEQGTDSVGLPAGLVGVEATVTVTDSDGDVVSDSLSADLSGSITIVDDMPSVELGDVDLSDVALETQDSDTLDGTSVATGSVAAAFSAAVDAQYGADGAGSTVIDGYALTLGEAQHDLTSGGEPIVFTLVDGVVIGSADGTEVLHIELDADTGAVTVTQSGPVDHAEQGTDSVGLPAGLVGVEATVTVTDSDGDVVSDSLSADLSGSITIVDDMPSVDPIPGNLAELDVDESAFGEPATADFSGAFEVVFGADGEGSVSYGLSIDGDGATGLVTTDGGQAITLIDDNGTIIGQAADGRVAFTITVNAASGEVTLTQNLALSHPDGTDPADVLGLAGSGLTLNATAADSDGDTITVGIDLGGQLSFVDDGPQASSDFDWGLLLQPGRFEKSGNVMNNDEQGADGAEVTHVQFGGETVELVDGKATIQGVHGELTIYSNGDYTYVRGDTPNHQGLFLDKFTYTLTDGDGDTDTATLNVKGLDAGVIIYNPVAGQGAHLVVNEANLANGTDPNAGELTQSGGFLVSAVDGLEQLTISIGEGGDQQTLTVTRNEDGSFNFDDASVDVPDGYRLEVTGITPLPLGGYVVNYAYTLQGNKTHAGSEDDALIRNFSITITDRDGDTASSSLKVKVIDDAPEADLAGARGAIEDGEAVVGTWNTESGADSEGAQQLISINGGPEQALQIGHAYELAEGTLTINENGTWTFVPGTNLDHSNGKVPVSFELIAIDGDGDRASDTHRIRIKDGEGPTPGGENGEGGTVDLVVDELGLREVGDAELTNAEAVLTFTAGSDNIVDFAFVNPGAINVSGLEEGVELSWVINEVGELIGSLGGDPVLKLTLNGGEIAAGESGTVTVNVELIGNLPHNANVDELTIGGVQVVASDSDGDVSAPGTISVRVDDDLPSVEGTDPSGHEVTITNLNSLAGYNSSFGYYIKDENGNPTVGMVIWANVKQDKGASYVLEGHAPGEVGYFIIPNGANLNSGLGNETEVTFQQVNGVWVAVAPNGDQLNGQNANAPVLFNDPSLNPGGASHVENNAEEGDINWEDVYGGGDKDYNDVNIKVEWAPANLTVDESKLEVDAEFDFSGYFSAEYGADGLATRDYSLSVAENGADSGLVDTQTGGEVLVKEGDDGQIVGYVVIDGEEVPVFTLSVDAETGVVTLDQLRAVIHSGAGQIGASDVTNILANVVFLTKTVVDTDSDEASATIDIGQVIHFLDGGPVAQNDLAETAEDTAITYNVMDNDIEGADGATLTAASLRNPSQGSITFGANGEVTFTPAAGFEGDAVIDYTVTDADGDTSSATLTVTVAEDSEPTIEVSGPDVNDGQTSVDEASLPNGSANDGSHATSGTLAINTGNDGLQSLVINGVNVTGGGTVNGTHGTLVVTLVDGEYNWTYTLDGATDDHETQGPNVDGVTDSFELVVTDSDGDKASDSLVIDIVDDVPTASDQSAGAVEEDGATTTLSGNLFSDQHASFGADGAGSVTWSGAAIESLANYGTLSLDANGNWSFTLNNSLAAVQELGDGDKLSFKLEFTVTDKDGDSDDGSLTIAINGNNDAPLTTDSAISTDEDVTVTLGVEAFGNYSDAEGDALGAVQIVTLPQNGVLELAGVAVAAGAIISEADIVSGKLTFTPDEDSDAEGSFTFKVQDAEGAWSEVANTATINVDAVADAPNVSIGIGEQTPVSEPGDVTPLPNGISHVKYVLSDGTTLKLDGYGGDIKDPSDPTKYIADIEAKTGLAVVSYYIKAGTGVYSSSGEYLGGFNNGPASDPLSNRADDEGSAGNYQAGNTYFFGGEADSYAFSINLVASLKDTDGSESLSLVISGVPEGAELNQGTENPDGTWTIEVAPGTQSYVSNGLTITVPKGTDEFTLTVKATATESNPQGNVSVETAESTASDTAAVDKLEVEGNGDSTVETGAGDDVLIGDMGGKFTITEPGQNYNISLIVDRSGSMGHASGSGSLSRMDLTKQALLNLANQLKDHDGTVNVQLVAFSSHASTSASIQNLNAGNVGQLISAITALSASGATNFEAAFEEAVSWFNSQNGNGASVVDGFKNLTYFLTDGDPTRYYDSDGGLRGSGNETSYKVFKNSVEAFEALSNISQVHGTGIGNGVSENYLRFFDNTDDSGEGTETFFVGYPWWDIFGQYPQYESVTGPVGEVDIVNTAEDLAAALQGGSSSDELAELGDDVLNGGDGDDIIFGDSVNTDHLEWTNGDTGESFTAGSHDGLGYAGLVEYLRWAEGTPGEAPSDAEVIAYVRDNWQDLVDSVRPDGGIDTLSGGAGNDILIGGAGDDTLNGGAGNDTLVGGLGADTFAWKLGDQGEEGSAAIDTVKDFSLEEGDSLDLSELLSDGNGPEHLRFEADGSGSTTLYISTEGNFGTDEGSFDNTLADQVIVLENFSGDLEALKSSLNID
nr:DUF5801 repeats-in-toxin domain-containing protein [Halomonas antri]